VFALPFSAIFANWLSFILFKWSLYACLLIPAHLMNPLNPADVANVFVANSIPQSVANVVS
jgi:hypothetical protein